MCCSSWSVVLLGTKSPCLFPKVTQKQEKKTKSSTLTLKKAGISTVLTTFLMLTQWLGALPLSTLFKPKIQSHRNNANIY